MFKTRNYFKTVIFLVSSFLSIFVIGCGGGSQSVMPVAPPPYPDSPFANENQVNSFNQSVPPAPQGRNYYDRNRNSFSNEWNRKQAKPLFGDRSASNYYSVEATSTIWVLIQDKFGNELEWISLENGQKAPISHSGPLTITCSSGEHLRITAPNGKPYKPAGKSKGISIIRIP